MQIRTRRAGMSVALAFALVAPSLPAFAEDFKLALVDPRRALLSSDSGKAAEKTITQLQEKKKAELDPRSARCKKMQEDVEAQRFVLSDEALQEKAIEFQSCQRDLERDFQAAKDELAVQERKLMAPLAKKLEDAVREIGKAQDFDLVLDRSTPGVLFAPDTLDITDLVIKKLNEN
jgi:outer membrane protein